MAGGPDSPRALEEGHQHLSRVTSPTATLAAFSDSSSPTLAKVTSGRSSGSQSVSVASAPNANRRGPARVSVPVNPHVGDPHFVGTIYDNNRNIHRSLDESTEKGKEIYLRHVQNLSRQWPRLRYLAEFMEAGTVPKKSAQLPETEVYQRKGRVKVAYIDFTNPDDLQRDLFTTREALEQGLKWATCSSSSDGSKRQEEKQETVRQNRLYIVEDLSSTTIELLGSRLSIDPTLFRDHLEDHTWFNIKDDWVEMPKLQSQLDTRQFVNLAYMRPIFFEDGGVSTLAKDQAGEWNVQRRLDFEGQVKSGKDAWWAESEHQVGLLRSKISVWSRVDDNGWTGVILVDPQVTVGHPLWNGYGQLHSPPGLSDSKDLDDGTSLLLPGIGSPFDTLISRIVSLPRSQLQTLSSDPERVTSHIYPLIFSEVLVTLEYSFTGLFQIEWQLDSQRTRHVDDLEDCIDSLHKWQRRLPFYVEYIEDSIAALRGRYHQGMTLAPPPPPPAVAAWQTSVLNDYTSLLTRLLTLQNRADKIMQMAVSIISIEESKKAMIESRNMGRITYLAFIFVPMSFVTSFLSMNEDLSQRSVIVYCVFFAISVPLLVLAVLVAMYWNRIMQWWEEKGEEKKKKNKKT
ncbi:hypothetical protein NLU13_9079 [Sarocladium strictum]|uniref:Uncharacterized protein n=1 Tax=Sarocladium strictum TaxID=5046 RepID=A0AA39G9U4_SARSR|nr:hypothetical protein NLU13_9079 [Sarocladium strictum]